MLSSMKRVPSRSCLQYSCSICCSRCLRPCYKLIITGETDVAAKAKKPKCLLSHFLSWKVVLLPSVFMLLMWKQHGHHVEDVLDHEGWRLWHLHHLISTSLTAVRSLCRVSLMVSCTWTTATPSATGTERPSVCAGSTCCQAVCSAGES